MQEKQKEIERNKKIAFIENNLINAGLIAVGLIILQDLIASGKFDVATFISAIAFALAIPILAVNIVDVWVTRELYSGDMDKAPISSYDTVLIVIGWFSSLVGIGAALWRISWIVTVVFLVSSVAAALSYFFRPYKNP